MQLAIAALAGMVIAAISIWSSRAGAVPEEEPVAVVNDSPVTAVEFMREAERQRASVIDYFYRTYGAKMGHHFWESAFNGENPETALKERTLKEIVRTKVELELFQEHGLIHGTSDADLIRELEKENERRRAAIRANQPVYGPVHLDEAAFRDIFISKTRGELKEKLSRNELVANDDTLMRHYEAIKDPMLISEGTVRFDKLTVSYKDTGSGDGDGRSKDRVRAEMADAKRLADQGMELAEAAKELWVGVGASVAGYTEEELNNRTAGAYYKFQPALYALLTGGLPDGRVSPVIDEAAQGSYVLVRITDREAGGYRSFEESRSQVESSYRDTAYSAYLNRLVEAARVDLHPQAWKALRLL